MLIHLKKSIANSFTILNLILGFVAIILTSLSFLDAQNKISTACTLIFIATIIDVFDGKIARKLGTSGPFGKQIDSLADLVSFCLAPSYLIFAYHYELVSLNFIYLVIISSLPLVCGAIRLARFNAYEEQSTNSYYLGLPTPGNALFICSCILFMFHMDFLIIESELLFFLNEFNTSHSIIFDWMKIPFGFLFSINDYIIIVVCSISSLLLLSKIHYAKFPIIKFGLPVNCN